LDSTPGEDSPGVSISGTPVCRKLNCRPRPRDCFTCVSKEILAVSRIQQTEPLAITLPLFDLDCGLPALVEAQSRKGVGLDVDDLQPA
jgi:hypothetical protein